MYEKQLHLQIWAVDIPSQINRIQLMKLTYRCLHLPDHPKHRAEMLVLSFPTVENPYLGVDRVCIWILKSEVSPRPWSVFS